MPTALAIYFLIGFAQVALAYAITDALAAIYHLLTDRGWNINSQCEFFINHHNRPWTMTFDLQPIVAGIPVLIAGYFFASLFLCSLGLFISFAQVPHYYTHHPAPFVVRVLQGCGIFIAPEKHALHHRKFDRDFCVVSGWNNFWVNRLAKWVPQC